MNTSAWRAITYRRFIS